LDCATALQQSRNNVQAAAGYLVQHCKSSRTQDLTRGDDKEDEVAEDEEGNKQSQEGEAKDKKGKGKKKEREHDDATPVEDEQQEAHGKMP
jgi:hypothetical protein